MLNVVGFRCAVCGAMVDVATALPWTCPKATADDRHHVLHIVRRTAPLRAGTDRNPFVAFDAELAWAAFAEAHGMTGAARGALVHELDVAVKAVAGVGFRVTPFRRSRRLSDELGFGPGGGVWVKDETGNVAGSHKARHLVTILLHLRAAELLSEAPWQRPDDRPPLAIASCGNAALAAATLARAAGWPIDVFVPTWASPVVIEQLGELGATITVCPRVDGTVGDPTVARFREAVAAGAVPFGVQGPENALCLDGGRTLGWEMYGAVGDTLDRVFVQVGGGAFAASTGAAFATAEVPPRLHAVQAEGCAPLVRAWERARRHPQPERHWVELMTPWDHPSSAADGILDDETYDWLGVFDALRASGGRPVVAAEHLIERARELAHHAGYPASHTGSAGLAGLLAIRDEVDPAERVAVVMSGVER